ncbi:MAG: hypothetical protein JWO52_1380 [Gammaproteobacteria bacterium]|nr:hypothetical protein [Gammaproteobacteria bacterium]
MDRGWSELSKAAQVEKSGIALTVRRLHGDVVDQARHTTCELTSPLLERADDVRQFEGAPISVWTESSRFAVIAIDLVILVMRFNRTREGM